MWGCVLCKEHGKKYLAIMLVVFLVSTFVAVAPKLPQSTVQVSEQPKTCGQIPTGKAVIVDDLVGVAKEVALRDILRIAEKNPILKEKLKNVDFSKAIVKASLLRINGELIHRTVIIAPIGNNKFVIYVKDTKTTDARISFERTTFNRVIIFEYDEQTNTLKSGRIIQPMSTCDNTPCFSDADCKSRDPWVPSSCSCTVCTSYNGNCLAGLAALYGVCQGVCYFGMSGTALLTCVSCLLAAGIAADYFCCMEEATTCRFYYN